ncbi:unnamed protein product (macronuclear) [Paramecium tetraurelia]|uniref:Uncharacterized protein n=1 Tax=Paramecium tetraurelia TaxID=5888 RepID=A0BVC5_PARTE|nr:uncharacterized protein GSPATT00005738001 [Paramecium tetraurelia]CAK62492.1 unnamed protein product [Paramecium tetraurelia]|eukprot:XP_001429890.1 hypothetical protein (macronuclear) [Paramecium tetraurelia strain d4-2]
MGICKSKKQNHSPPILRNQNVKTANTADIVRENSPNNVAAGSQLAFSQQDFFIRSQELMTPDRLNTANKGKFFNTYTLLNNLKSPNEQIRQVCTVQHNQTGVTKIGIIQTHHYKQADLIKVQNKIQQLKKLDHPNIMSIYEFFVDSKQLYIVTENYDGGTLLSRLKFENKEESTRKNQLIQIYFQQILAGLQYLHSNGINHKNLKPENILFQSQQSQLIKLVDYSNTRVNKKDDDILDLTYLAPEVIQNQEFSQASDIWSCGVLLYEIWTKFQPFKGDNYKEKKENILKCRITKDENWNQIPIQAQKLINSMLKIDPSKRLTAAQCLQNEYLKNIVSYTDKTFVEDVFQRIQQYQSKSEFQKLLLSIMINKLMDEKEKEKLMVAFEAIDDNKDGKITKSELKKFLASEKQKSLTNKIFQILDSNQNGYIEFNEFLLASCNTDKLVNQENLELLFKFIDKNQSQQITIKELKSLFIEARLTDKEWELIFNQGDLNQNGKISFQEFSQLLQQTSN